MANKKRLIDSNELKSEFEWLRSVVNESSKDEIQEIIQRIENAPTVDALEVVRCKDCVYWKEHDGEMFCNHWGNLMTDTAQDDFCSYGERRTDG